jgi:ribosome-associated protein
MQAEMNTEDISIRNFVREFTYSASRSSGPGGQNVNKVNTKVELRFSLFSTTLLTEDEKNIILKKLKKRINKDGELVLVSQAGRTQAENKSIVTLKFYELLAKALTIPEIRRSTRPTLSSRIKRLDEKKIRSTVKKLRKQGNPSEDI